MIKYRTKHIILQKNGLSLSECEDAFSKFTKRNKRFFAIADGATESSFSKEWSEIIVSEFRNEKLCNLDNFINYINNCSVKWNDFVKTKDLPWYAEQKVQNGAFSTFLGLYINSQTNELKSIAVGDSCLFIVRSDELIYSFPSDNFRDFNNNPFLISSNLNKNIKLIDYLKLFTCNLVENDLLIMTTDALSAWFLEQNEKNEKPWNIILGIFDHKKVEYQQKFSDWIREQRNSKLIKNDDIVITLIEI